MFYLMWSGFEDAVLAAMAEPIQPPAPPHMSLRFDGVRVSKQVLDSDPELLRHCEEIITAKTGVTVKIASKVHSYFFHELSLHEAVPDCNEGLLVPGRCILAGLSNLAAVSADTVAKLIAALKEAPATVGRGSSKYSDFATPVKEQAGLVMHAEHGLHLREPGKYLIHSECDGRPHCIAVEVIGDSCTVYDLSLIHI